MPSTSLPEYACICVYIYLGWPKRLFECFYRLSFLMENPKQTFWPIQYTLNNQNDFHGPQINFLLIPALDLTSST